MHPNSRFTAPWAVPLCLVPYRTSPWRADLGDHSLAAGATVAPLVYEAFDWEHGTFVGATMASERTAAQVGKVGEVRRDPMAMIPFCGYHMGDYFEHWLNMGRRMTNPPKVFHVNWFRADENGKFLWPGYGENLRVIEWILDRCRGDADAVKTPIGYVPTPESLDLNGLEISRDALYQLFAVNRNDWYEETEDAASFFQTFGNRFPKVLWDQLEALRQRLRCADHADEARAEIRPLAAELNEMIERENPHVFSMLSEFGKRLYFPKGILARRRGQGESEAIRRYHRHRGRTASRCSFPR